MWFVLISVVLALINNVLAEQNVAITDETITEAPQDMTTLGLDTVKTNITNNTRNVTPGPHTVERCFLDGKIVPDIIPVTPESIANVTYANNVIVSLGNILTPTKVKEAPIIIWNASLDNYYTVIAIDPDVPSRRNPLFREALHWLRVNIPGNNTTAGETLAQYISAGPPALSGVHRFIFLVYQQPDVTDFSNEMFSQTTTFGRNGFSTNGFARKYNLSSPVAGNFFYTAYDSYVPILYKQLGISQAVAVAPENMIVAALIFVFFWNRNIFL